MTLLFQLLLLPENRQADIVFRIVLMLLYILFSFLLKGQDYKVQFYFQERQKELF